MVELMPRSVRTTAIAGEASCKRGSIDAAILYGRTHAQFNLDVTLKNKDSKKEPKKGRTCKNGQRGAKVKRRKHEPRGWEAFKDKGIQAQLTGSSIEGKCKWLG